MNLRNKLPALKYRTLGLVVLPLDLLLFYLIYVSSLHAIIKSCIQLIIVLDIVLCLIALYIGDVDKE
ncbi:hypothetical protein [Vallitalea okinawensis]|uniref:hypothetical protein n=1 Tax=Vallitalea okinawensis TaxID=2078660 RepID=UPI000CFCB362|nr:hypothetical protein [Vallitalea okinawensis]